jgi:exopolysaccharide biosynthesis polyprenyl glycosylphosphotransferase
MTNALNLRKTFLFGGDIASLYLSLIATIFIRYWSDFSWQLVHSHLLPLSIVYIFWILIFYVFGLYELHILARTRLYLKIGMALLVCLLLGISFFYLFPIFEVAPKTNLIINAVVFGMLFILWRKAYYSVFSSKMMSKIAVIGSDEVKNDLKKAVNDRPYLGYKITELDNKKDLKEQIIKEDIDILVIPTDLDYVLAKDLYLALSTRINFIDWAQAYELICEKIPVSLIPHGWFLNNLKERERASYIRFKRIIDIVLAIFTLTVSLPLFIVVSLLIKIEDRKSVLYRQKRVGKDENLFSLFKFRSMREDAENKTGAVWAKEKDSRATKIGKILRQTHLDELPQMINILKGDISFVGPRPERPEFVEQLKKEIPYYEIRSLIKPGFTGWAQIKFRYGRTVMDSKEKFEYDLYYLKNRNPLLDMGVLLKTFQLFFKK